MKNEATINNNRVIYLRVTAMNYCNSLMICYWKLQNNYNIYVHSLWPRKELCLI